MPWKWKDPMEKRIWLEIEVARNVFQMGELCQRYGVSLKADYKCLQQYCRKGQSDCNIGVSKRTRGLADWLRRRKCSKGLMLSAGLLRGSGEDLADQLPPPGA